jgi:cation diffusion facilitator family transporter
VGRTRSLRKADKLYQFGYGKELYFWALLAAVTTLMITATLSFYFGVERVLHPAPITYMPLAIAVLALALLTNGYALSVSVRRLLGNNVYRELPTMFASTPFLASKTAVVLDGAGVLAAVFGLVNLIIYSLTGNSHFDGIGAMLIGMVLAVFAVVLLTGVRSFITGRSVSTPMARNIRSAALSVPGVNGILDMRTMILGGSGVLVLLELDLDKKLDTPEIEQLIDHIKAEVGRAIPVSSHIQIEPETRRTRRRKERV